MGYIKSPAKTARPRRTYEEGFGRRAWDLVEHGATEDAAYYGDDRIAGADEEGRLYERGRHEGSIAFSRSRWAIYKESDRTLEPARWYLSGS